MAEIWNASKKNLMSIQSLKHSDCITTTTEKLSQTFGRFNKDVHIFRNMFDWELPQWNFDKKTIRKEMVPEWNDKDMILGWAGLTSHFEDIKRMHGIFKSIHDKYPNIKFVLAGMALKDTQIEIKYDEKGQPTFKEKEIQDENILYRNRVKNLYSDLDPNRLKIFDALPLEEYAKFYALFDISLAYVEHNAFASCKCLVPGTRVITEKGIQTIENLKIDDCVVSPINEWSENFKLEKGKNVLESSSYTTKSFFNDNKIVDKNKVLNSFVYRDKDVVKLITRDGYEIAGTLHHRIKDDKDEYKNLSDFKKGDKVRITPFDITKNEYEEIKYPLLMTKGITEEDRNLLDKSSLPLVRIDENWGRLIGYFIGDGGFTSSRAGFSVASCARDKKVTEDIKNLLLLIGLHPRVYEEDKGAIGIGASSLHLKNIFIGLGILNRRYKKQLTCPDIIFKSPKSVIKNFIQGLFEADGGIDIRGRKMGFVTKSEQLAKDVQLLLLGFAIRSRIIGRHIKNKDQINGYKDYGIYYTVSLGRESTELYRKQIGFISDFKRSRLNLSNEPVPNQDHETIINNWIDEVDSVVFYKDDVYDIEVENKHEYIANGFISHNSEIKAIESLHYDCITVFSDFGGYHDFWKEVPQKLKRSNVGISVTSPKVWSDALGYWIENYDEAKKYFSELKQYSDETYDINKHVEERLSYYMEKIEHFDEEQTNEIAKYTYYDAA